jgi:hypothetical protein
VSLHQRILLVCVTWLVMLIAVCGIWKYTDDVAANGARDERRAERPCAVDAKGGVTCPAEEGTRARRRP